MDNAGSAEPFSGDALRAAEALARHAALAIENAQLFEREQHTIEELQKAQKQLLQSEKLATIGQMAAGIAHELNTPLTYIMGNLELLELQDLYPVPAGDALLDRPRAPSASGRWPSASSPSAARAARRWRPSRSTTWSSAASSCASTRSRAAA